MFNGTNCDRKSQLSGILTEPLNPRGLHISIIFVKQRFKGQHSECKSLKNNLNSPFKSNYICGFYSLGNVVFVLNR